MLPKVLLVLLNIFLFLQSRVEGPQTALENEDSTRDVVVYGPQPQPPSRKLLSEETKPTASVIGRPSGKLPEASRILNTILSNYDHKLRPGIGEKPTVVTVEVSVNSLGPLSILDMEYTIDIIFLQTLYDERLRYNDTFETLVLNGNVVSQLWIPDTFFRNSKRTQEHEITMPNQMVRIHKDGKVLYTIRESEKSCSLSVSAAKVSEFMVMTFFFNVSRRFAFVAFHNYVPSSVTTMLSWVSFWIKKESAPARTSLGITSVLTMTTLGTFSRKNFPRVSYITALDFYIAVCFVFCFCALVEFAVLNFLTYNQTKAHASPKFRHPPLGSRAHAHTCASARARARQQQEAFMCEIVTSEGSDGEEHLSSSAQRPPSPGIPQGPRNMCIRCCDECNKGFKKYFCMIPDCEGSTWQQGRVCIHIYRLDDYSRVLFPVSFFFFNVLYWLVCLNL
ncbi:Hypothetical predicted protein [Marmota monax]|uniref:Neurotransmitter-gated ion-channel transmembrane domain-containing protein n=1 Tax=Marmota monax TaxID=9995 RepID=A0A5E4D9Q0_MARMO|nr:Hypothetical predicted protein [Marmota monax]